MLDFILNFFTYSKRVATCRRNSKKTPLKLMEFASKGDVNGVKKCLKEKIDPNVELHYKMPLLIACSHGFIEVFNLLIENGADVNMCNSKAWTPLHCASRSGHLEITKALLYRGAQTDAENVRFKCSLLVSVTRNIHLKIRHRYISKHPCIMLHSMGFTISHTCFFEVEHT